MTTGKTVALTTRTFVSKMISLLFNTVSGRYSIVPERAKEDRMWRKKEGEKSPRLTGQSDKSHVILVGVCVCVCVFGWCIALPDWKLTEVWHLHWALTWYNFEKPVIAGVWVLLFAASSQWLNSFSSFWIVLGLIYVGLHMTFHRKLWWWLSLYLLSLIVNYRDKTTLWPILFCMGCVPPHSALFTTLRQFKYSVTHVLYLRIKDICSLVHWQKVVCYLFFR